MSDVCLVIKANRMEEDYVAGVWTKVKQMGNPFFISRMARLSDWGEGGGGRITARVVYVKETAISIGFDTAIPYRTIPYRTNQFAGHLSVY